MLLAWLLFVDEWYRASVGPTSAGTLLLVFARLLTLVPFAALVTFEILGAYAAGYQLGRMASYGLLSQDLRRRSCQLRIIPGHPDGAAGLKPIGDFYFFQAMLASLPAIFLAGWSIAFALWGVHTSWRGPYLALLPVAIGGELLTFILPLWWFHQEMTKQRLSHLREADRLSIDINRLQAKLLDSSEDQAVQLKDRLTEATQRYWDIERIPVGQLMPGLADSSGSTTWLLFFSLSWAGFWEGASFGSRLRTRSRG